jgi:DNA (cytosine-5)-methyltransferase 1
MFTECSTLLVSDTLGENMKAFKFIDLFCGIGGFHQAAHANGGKCVFASDIDVEAAKAYAHNYGITPHGDITKIDPAAIPQHDMLLAGFPCQPFSIIGQRKGFDDIRGTLFFEIVKILQQNKPPMIVLENVKQLATHDGGRTLQRILKTLEKLGYKISWKILNALHFGIPQKRERTIIVGFLDHNIDFVWPKRVEEFTSLEEILEKDVADKHYTSPEIRKKRKRAHKSQHETAIWHENKSGNISSYPYSCALRAGASYNYLLVNGERRLTPREMLRLQGFPDDFEIVCSDTQTRKQAGNAVPVPMIQAVIKEVINAYSKAQRFKKKDKERSVSVR